MFFPIPMAKTFCFTNHLRVDFAIALTPLNSPPLLKLFSIPCCFQFFHKPLFLDLGKDGHDGDHACGHLIGFFGETLSVYRGEKLHPSFPQERETKNVGFHLTSETTHILDNDRPDTVVFDSVQQSSEARTVLDSIDPLTAPS